MINHNNLQSVSRLKQLQYFNDLIINIFILLLLTSKYNNFN